MLGRSLMLSIKKIETQQDLSHLKAQYFASSISALDGMWHFGFVPMAEHFGFYEEEVLTGFCCINDEGYILQFYLAPQSNTSIRELFRLIVEQNSKVIQTHKGDIKGAFVSTAETAYLALCLDNAVSFKNNALMYQQGARQQGEVNIQMQRATCAQIKQFVHFAAANIGAPEAWLTTYFTNLITRKELFGLWEGDTLLASGECRLFDEYQTDYADLGMIVAQSERGKGLATQVLKYLVKHAETKGLRAICSTEMDNIAAQKAIVRAGFSASHRIVQFEFESQ